MTMHLEGGRDTIRRERDGVCRPAHAWTRHVYDFLRFLHACGFDTVPFPLAWQEDGVERVSFLEGDVPQGILPEAARSDETLVEVAKWMRAFHELGTAYLAKLTGDEQWMFPVDGPVETMCHGDLAPYNTVLQGSRVLGVIDFDTLHPGPSMWDLAYAAYRWVPLMDGGNPENFGSEADKARRMAVFMDAYGASDDTKLALAAWVERRIAGLMAFMETEAEQGNEVFRQHIADGHLSLYRKDLAYVRRVWLPSERE